MYDLSAWLVQCNDVVQCLLPVDTKFSRVHIKALQHRSASHSRLTWVADQAATLLNYTAVRWS